MEITKNDILWIKLRSKSIQYSPKLIFYWTNMYFLRLLFNIVLTSLFGYTVIINNVSDLGIKVIHPFALFHDADFIFAGSVRMLIFRFRTVFE
jgi:hypothetical protein